MRERIPFFGNTLTRFSFGRNRPSEPTSIDFESEQAGGFVTLWEAASLGGMLPGLTWIVLASVLVATGCVASRERDSSDKLTSVEKSRQAVAPKKRTLETWLLSEDQCLQSCFPPKHCAGPVHTHAGPGYACLDACESTADCPGGFLCSCRDPEYPAMFDLSERTDIPPNFPDKPCFHPEGFCVRYEISPEPESSDPSRK